jgi:hypothetical protein
MADNPPARPRFKFRLRTLFVVVTLIAAASWVVVDRQRLIRKRDDPLQREQATKKSYEEKQSRLMVKSGCARTRRA